MHSIMLSAILTAGLLLFLLVAMGYVSPETAPISSQLSPPPSPSRSPGACTSFCLNNGDHCVFGTNQDNTLEIGMLFVNKRNLLKTTWDPSLSGEFARWVSRYGSVTVNFVSYQMVWAGMNEAGLMISTMGAPDTRGPISDQRSPFQGPFWMQYQLDNHATVGQVIASDAEIRLPESSVDHYLVCDRTGACATIEFLEGKLVSHSGDSLPVSALTNSVYDVSVSVWEESRLEERPLEDNSLLRFVTAANRVHSFEPSSAQAAITYAFDTLEMVSRDDTVWSFVFDPLNMRVHFRTNRNPDIRYLDYSRLDFSCQTPVRLLDVHANVSGNISDMLDNYSHAQSFAHSSRFFSEFEGFSMSPLLVDTLLWGLESFPCQDSIMPVQAGLARYRPVLPPTVAWAGLTIAHRVGPYWILLVALSLVVLVWLMYSGKPASADRLLLWVLLTILLGPFSLLAYRIGRRNKRAVGQ